MASAEQLHAWGMQPKGRAGRVCAIDGRGVVSIASSAEALVLFSIGAIPGAAAKAAFLILIASWIATLIPLSAYAEMAARFSNKSPRASLYPAFARVKDARRDALGQKRVSRGVIPSMRAPGAES